MVHHRSILFLHLNVVAGFLIGFRHAFRGAVVPRRSVDPRNKLPELVVLPHPHQSTHLSAAATLSSSSSTESPSTKLSSHHARRRRRMALRETTSTPRSVSTATVTETSRPNDDDSQLISKQQQQQQQQQQQELFQQLCERLDQTNDNDDGPTRSSLLQLRHTGDEGYRGVFLQREVKKDQILLSVPLSVCLRDDCPPSWFRDWNDSWSNSADDWATRLAASLLDGPFNPRTQPTDAEQQDLHQLWISLLPDADFLRASLPVHWSSEELKSAASTALELAVDSSYFVRGRAVQDLMEAFPERPDHYYYANDEPQQQRRRWCDNALDVVQTRTCRVESSFSSKPLRLLAPVFDFINHHPTAANGAFYLQRDCLVVQALRDMAADEEVWVDYGRASTRPAYQCLCSYGFVPDYDSNNNDSEALDDEETAEVYLEGQRYEVGPTSIPETMVAALSEDEEIALTPAIARRLEERISEAAYNMLMDPWKGASIERVSADDAEDNNYYSLTWDEDDDDTDTQSALEIWSSRLAAQLRFHQHRILLTCAQGIGEWAAAQESEATGKAY